MRNPAIHKRYYTTTDVESLEDHALLEDDDDDDDESTTTSSPDRVRAVGGGTSGGGGGGGNGTNKVKCLVVIPFLVFFALLYIPLFHSVNNHHRSVALPGWWKNVSRDLRTYVQPDRNTSVIEPNGSCDISRGDKTFLLVVVCSAVKNFDERDTIRETWGNVTAFNYPAFRAMHDAQRGNFLVAKRQNWSEYVVDGADVALSEQNFTVKVIFLVGQTNQAFNTNEFPDELQAKVQEEADKYGDILQEGFLDTYNNLTIKSVMMLKWVTQKCDGLKYLLKVDDDTFINLPNLIHILIGGTIPVYNTTVGFHDRDSILVRKAKNRLVDTKNLLLGHLFCNVKPVADTSSKWYTPYYMYQGDIYPAYLSGTAYLMSMSAAQQLYNTSLTTPYFHLEDVYLTGICASKRNLKRTHHPLFFYATVKEHNKSFCSLRGMVSQHQMSPGDLKLAYDAVTDQRIKCAAPSKSLSTKLKLQMKRRCAKN